MIRHDVAQGTPEWLALRLGIPTASEFHKILTPTGQLSKQSRGYAIRLATEHLLNRTLDTLTGLQWVDRGKELEADAVKMYEFENDLQTEKIGFITNDEGTIGASPDRLIIGRNGAVEIKCPAPHTHLEYMIDGFGKDYLPQVQGQMLIGEFEFVDRYSYSPEMPPVLIRTYRDAKFIAKLKDALAEFLDMKAEIIEIAKQKGVYHRTEIVRTAQDIERGDREESESPFGDEEMF